MKARVDLDKVGAVASAICAVHCLLTGVALGLLSVIGLGFIGSVPAEIAFISVALFIGSWAIIHGIRRHHSYIPAMVFVFGLFSIGLSHFFFPHSHSGGTTNVGGTFFAVLGGLSLVSFHVLNFKLQRGCSCGHCSHKE